MHYPIIDPVIFSVGPLAVHWYGLAYLVAFLSAWGLGVWRADRSGSGWTRQEVSDLVFYGAIGAVLGGRFGYVFFYGFDQFLSDPLWLVRIWDGGMSFHGGLLGVAAAIWWFARNTGRTLWQVADFGAPLVPIGLGLGRLGNFVNVELPGRATESALGMIYPCGAEAVRRINATCVGQWESFARHPSPLYQAFAEGLVLFVIVWLYSGRQRPTGMVCGLFLASYGTLRFITEHFREPDAHIGYIAFDWLTMGQVLSLPMLLLGVAIMVWSARQAGTQKSSG